MIDLTTDEQIEGPEFESRPRLRFFSTHRWGDTVVNQLWQGFTFNEAFEAATDFHLSLPVDERQASFNFGMETIRVVE